MTKFNSSTFIISTIVFGLLMVPGLLAAYGEDEGTLTADSLWIVFANLYYVLRFPTHYLFWTIISNKGPLYFFAGLIINCLFYGLLTERVIYYFKRQKSEF